MIKYRKECVFSRMSGLGRGAGSRIQRGGNRRARGASRVSAVNSQPSQRRYEQFESDRSKLQFNENATSG